MTTTHTVHAEITYPVLVGPSLLDEIGPALGDGVQRVLIIHAPSLGITAQSIRENLQTFGLEVFLAEIPDAEEAKTAQVAAFCWQILGQANFTRSDAIIGLGGGATTDLAGFIAATWLRGIAVVHLPTTLLGMVDAAVGGKTGINTGEGKNLVGAFHSPRAVICDIGTLATLPRHDLIAGLAEVVKCGFIADPQILNALREVSIETLETTSPVLTDVINRAIAVKADVVSQDLKESDLREILNYGHTFAHAIELNENFRWRHGAAVSVGMMYAAELAHLAGHLSADDVAHHREILTHMGLPVTYRGDRWLALLSGMRRDKKSRGSTLRFVVLDGIGKPTRLEGPREDMLQEAYRRISATQGTTVLI